MENAIKALIGLSALAFAIAVLGSLSGASLPAPPEAFSRASSNLALLAIAVTLVARGGASSGR